MAETLLNGAPTAPAPDAGGPSNAAENADDSPENVELDAVADAMMLELARSQADVQEMLLEQRVQNDELGGLKAGLTNELQGLQEDAWKLQMFSELEMLKSQLATLTNLETSLDAAEAILEGDAEEDAEAGQSDTLSSTAAIIDRVNRRAAAASASAGQDAAAQIDQDGGGVEGGEEELDYEGDAAEIAALQATLDAELAEMFSQLQAVKAQAANVAVRKAQLEAELDALLAQQLEDDQADAADAVAVDVANLQLSPAHS